MIYCGIDGSTTSTGVSIFNDEELIFYDCIKPKSKDWQIRLKILANQLNDIFSQYEIDRLYIEDVPLKDGKLTIEKLSAVRGVVLALCGLYGIDIDAESVSNWRQNADFYDGTKEGMKRDAMKEKAVKEVHDVFGIDVNDDIAEAILVAYRTRYPKEKKTFGKKPKIK